MPAKRDVSPILVALRDFCSNRKIVNQLRFQNEIAARTQPPPRLPEGPQAKLSNNYYYMRDPRGQIKPETVLVDRSSVLRLAEGGQKPAMGTLRTPGKIKNWDI